MHLNRTIVTNTATVATEKYSLNQIQVEEVFFLGGGGAEDNQVKSTE